jgi:hypothetical protein
MPRLSVEDRIRETYIEMARQANHRPHAPEGARRDDDLQDEAAAYAQEFIAEEQTTEFDIGVSDYTTNRALVYTIEAARCMCAGAFGADRVVKLLEMALKEAKTELAKVPPLPEEFRGVRVG